MRPQRPSDPLVLAAFVVGVAAGVALAWLLEDGAPSAAPQLSADADPVSPQDANPTLMAKGKAPPKSSDLPAEGPRANARGEAAPAPLPPFQPPAESDLPPGVAGWIRVEVVPPPGQAEWGGEAYALAPGAPGVDDIDLVPHADAYTGEPGRLAVVRPGRYDVGLVQGQLHLLERDVNVVAGETATVVFRIPASQGVTVTLADALPQVTGWYTQLNVQLTPVGVARACSYPGRGEWRSASWGWPQRKRSMTVGRLMPGQRYRVQATLSRYQVKPKSRWKNMTEHAVVCSPDEVGPGTEVSVRIRPSGLVSLHVVLDPTSWPVGIERTLHVEVEHAGGTTRRMYAVEQDGDMTNDYTFPLLVPAGPLAVRWRGDEIQAGALEGLQVGPAETTRVEAEITYTGRRVTSARPVHVEIEWPKSKDGNEALDLAGVWIRSDGEHDIRTSDIQVGDDSEHAARLRGAVGLIARIGQEWATGPLEAPRGDTLRVRPVRGGLVVVAPEVTRPDSMGYLVLKRPDGLPIPCPDEGWELNVRAETGRVLGPFIPGEHTFQVWLGSRRLPDVKAIVRAGRTAALVIPE